MFLQIPAKLIGALIIMAFAAGLAANAQAPSSVQMTNSTGQQVDIYVSSGAGDPQYQGTLEPNQSETVASSVGETWFLASTSRKSCAIRWRPLGSSAS